MFKQIRYMVLDKRKNLIRTKYYSIRTIWTVWNKLILFAIVLQLFTNAHYFDSLFNSLSIVTILLYNTSQNLKRGDWGVLIMCVVQPSSTADSQYSCLSLYTVTLLLKYHIINYIYIYIIAIGICTISRLFENSKIEIFDDLTIPPPAFREVVNFRVGYIESPKLFNKRGK